MATNKGFIKDWQGNYILPITRGELVLDLDGNIALQSDKFLAKDNHPGLVTSAERAILSSLTTNNSVADVYNKIDYINKGLKFGELVLNFYNEEGSTPISINSVGDNKISISVLQNNTVNLGLAELSTTSTSIDSIVRKISVDKWGRVTEVSGSPLTNSDIPETLSSKILDGCTTESVSTSDNAIVNKKYVDDKFSNITNIATGALKFGGTITADNYKGILQNAGGKNNAYNYYKAVASFTIEGEYIYTGLENETIQNQNIKSGDTLIVYPVASSNKFVYVPSGDDITAITVASSTGDVISLKTGHVKLQFSNLFSVVNPENTNIVQVSIPQASSTTSGYLSSQDYNDFKNYTSNLKVEYTSKILENAPGLYLLGTISAGTDSYDVYGLNTINTYNLSLDVENTNPVLKFTENSKDSVKIAYVGSNGININKDNNNNIVVSAANTVLDLDVPQDNNPRTAKYLIIEEGYKFGVQLGKTNADGSVTDGLTDYSQFSALVKSVNFFETISYSLTGSENSSEYRYGNAKLKTAIAITV